VVELSRISAAAFCYGHRQRQRAPAHNVFLNKRRSTRVQCLVDRLKRRLRCVHQQGTPTANKFQRYRTVEAGAPTDGSRIGNRRTSSQCGIIVYRADSDRVYYSYPIVIRYSNGCISLVDRKIACEPDFYLPLIPHAGSFPLLSGSAAQRTGRTQNVRC